MMHKMIAKTLAATVLMIGAGGSAQASSSDAWAQFQLEVAQRCATESRLDHAHVSQIVGFDDRLGKVVTLVNGRTRARRGSPVSTVTKLCVFDKRQHQAFVDDAPGWRAPDLK